MYRLRRVGLDKEKDILDLLQYGCLLNDPYLRSSIDTILNHRLTTATLEGDPFLPRPVNRELEMPGT